MQLEDGRRVLVATRNLQVVVEQTSSADPGHAAVGPAVRDWLDTNAESIQRASAQRRAAQRRAAQGRAAQGRPAQGRAAQ